jgi:hypothetical protein
VIQDRRRRRGPRPWLHIGPDSAGNLLEVVVLITAEGTQTVIHAIESLAAEAEAGYDVEPLIARRNKRGRPTLANAPSSVEPVRLYPELRRQLLDRAEAREPPPPS